MEYREMIKVEKITKHVRWGTAFAFSDEAETGTAALRCGPRG